MHFQFMPVNGWVNSVGPDDAQVHELHHELGERVHEAIESEAIGFGALFDLQADIYFKENA